MSKLEFAVLDVSAEPYAASPNLLFKLRITETSGEAIHAMALRCQIRIEPQRRPYTGPERDGLIDLFGLPEQWGKTLRPFLWTHAATMVKGFSGSIDVDLPVACTYDFEVAGSKYLHALEGGEVPLVLLFSGTVFSRGATGFGVEQVPWHHEAEHRMPIQVWRDLMNLYFPNSGWIRIDRDTLDALIHFKSSRGLTSWEAAFAELLPALKERAS